MKIILLELFYLRFKFNVLTSFIYYHMLKVLTIVTYSIRHLTVLAQHQFLDAQ